MALPALHLLAAAVSSLLSSYTITLERLAIHYPCAGLGITTHTSTEPFAQSAVQPFPGALDPPSSEVMVDGFPGRKVVRKWTPGASAADCVEDGVKDLAQGVHPGPPGGIRSRQVRLHAGPLGIGEVGRVRLSHAC